MQEDLLRQLNELAVNSGKKMRHPDSRFVQFTGQPHEGFIPIYENFLFALSLLRSKTQENILEARELLERLFYFQQRFQELPHYGNFPLFVHEFPYVRNDMQAVRVLHVLFWVQKEFNHVLGNDCAKRLSSAIELLLPAISHFSEIRTLPLWAKAKIAALYHAFGKRGDFPDLSDETELRTWQDPHHLAELIAAYQIAPEATNWLPLWRYLSKTWHDPLKCYSGPAFKRVFDEYEPEVTLYDYYMGYFSGGLREQAKGCQLAALNAALVRPQHLFTMQIESSFVGKNERFSWFQVQNEFFALSTIIGAPQPEQTYGFFTFELLACGHILGMQLPYSALEEASFKDNTVKLTLQVNEDVYSENNEKNRVLYLAVDDQKGTEFIVSHTKASCFELSEPVCLKLGTLNCDLSFEVIEGNGQFRGHIAKGNRLGQKHKELHFGYDKLLFIRSIRGSGPCKLIVYLKLSK